MIADKYANSIYLTLYKLWKKMFKHSEKMTILKRMVKKKWIPER